MRVASRWRMMVSERPRLASGLVFIGMTRPRDANEMAVREAQTTQLLCQVPNSALVSILVSFCLAAALGGRALATDLAIWLTLVTAFNLGRRRWAQALLCDEARVGAATTRLRLVLLMAICAAALSSIPGLFWFDHVGIEGKLIICVLIAGMMSGGCVSLSGLPLAAILYVTILGAVMINDYVSIGLNDLAVITVLFTLSLIGTALTSARQLVASFRVELELAEKCKLVELLRAFDASGSSWVWEIDRRFRVTTMSSDMAQMLGFDGCSIIGRSARKVLDPSGHGLDMSGGFRTLVDHVGLRTEFRDLALPVLDGRRWWSMSGQPVFDGHGELTGWRGVGSDISNARLTGSDSIAAARRDPLTKLANRLMIREMVEEALMRNAAGGPSFGLLLIDLDRFKQVNDTLGHVVGDQLLVQVAMRLQLATAGVGRVGRLGGDEFAILIPDGVKLTT